MRFHYFFFSNRDVLRVSPDSDTTSLRLNSAQEFITISKITLEHAAQKLRNRLRIS